MAGSVNKVILIGYLGKDPEVRRNTAGEPIATISVATSDTWRDKATGERKEKTEWHRVVVFAEGLAKACEQYLKKGSHVYFEGKLQTRKWTDQAGVEKYTTEVVLTSFNSSMVMLDRRPGGPPAPDSAEDYGTTRSSEPGRAAAPPVGGRGSDMDDDIPF